MPRRAILLLALLASPALAREGLGTFGGWGAFRDVAVPRCYAIALAEPTTRKDPVRAYADVAWWPRKGVRGQVHFRLARAIAPGGKITLSIGGARLTLVGAGSDAWAADRQGDAVIIAAMRTAQSMTLNARDTAGQGFASTWKLSGAATAMDAAAVGCAQLR